MASADTPPNDASTALDRARSSSLRRETEDFFGEIGENIRELFSYLGGLSRMLREVGRNIVRPPFGWDDIVEDFVPAP